MLALTSRLGLPASIASKLCASGELRARLVSEALSILASKRIKGSPRSIAALAIYAAARKLGLHILREQVAEAAGVSITTMRRGRELAGGEQRG
ncbi:MAG: hypothetical protein DRJ69_00780 [Thermoprotei archaeon]|nr:MAG: hypothetical protein DRJ69_00780 [Thermoprotei archaeon]